MGIFRSSLAYIFSEIFHRKLVLRTNACGTDVKNLFTMVISLKWHICLQDKSLKNYRTMNVSAYFGEVLDKSDVRFPR